LSKAKQLTLNLTAPTAPAVGLLTLCAMSILVGAVTGAGAVFLRGLIGLIHNLFFLGKFSLAYDATQVGPPGPWGPFVILAPVIGGLIVVYLVKNFAPEAKGHGVPEVIDAIYYNGGRIRPVVVVIKSLASALSIGSGASVGREGPIIQIGSGIGSLVGQLRRLPSWQTITLVAAGTGAGIAATFNTPLGAVMFAIEITLPELSARTLLPVVLATGAATYVGRAFFGLSPAFIVPMQHVSSFLSVTNLEIVPLHLLIGALCGLAAAGFIRLLYWSEDFFDAMPGNPYSRNIVGMLLLGVLMYGMLLVFNDYYVAGVGYSTIQGILTGRLDLIWLFALLFCAKLAATCLSLGSGASGGIFSPSLFMGATVGGFFGAGVQLLWPNIGFGPMQFAVIGMAAMVAGGMGAAMTGILMIFEMTSDYNLIVPVIMAVAVSIGVRRALVNENIYTLKLARRGHGIPKDRHSHMFMIRHARETMTAIDGVVPFDAITDPERRVPSGEDRMRYVVVSAGNRIAGVLPLAALGRSDAGHYLIRRYILARENDFLQNVMERMRMRNRRVALVASGGRIPRPANITGVITAEQIGHSVLGDIWA
jgi:CIC family chloride channel protein